MVVIFVKLEREVGFNLIVHYPKDAIVDTSRINSFLTLLSLSPEPICVVDMVESKAVVVCSDDYCLIIWRKEIPFSKETIQRSTTVLTKLYKEGKLRSEHLAPLELLDGDFSPEIVIEHIQDILDFRELEYRFSLDIVLEYIPSWNTLPNQVKRKILEVLSTCPKTLLELLNQYPSKHLVDTVQELVKMNVLQLIVK